MRTTSNHKPYSALLASPHRHVGERVLVDALPFLRATSRLPPENEISVPERSEAACRAAHERYALSLPSVPRGVAASAWWLASTAANTMPTPLQPPPKCSMP